MLRPGGEGVICSTKRTSSAQDIAASSMSCLRVLGMVLLGVFGCCGLPGVDVCVRKWWMDGWMDGGERVYKERWMRV